MEKIKDTLSDHIENTIKREMNSVLQEWKGELDKAFHHVHAKQKDLDNQITTATLKIKELENNITEMKIELNSQAQSFLRNEAEISGMAETTQENLFHKILVLAQRVGMKLEDKDLDSVVRVGAPRRHSSTGSTDAENKPNYPRPVVVRFARRALRDDFIRACKSRRNLSNKDIETHDVETKIYVNESMTAINRNLFRDARRRAKLKNFKHCWTKGGIIYTRAYDGAHAKAIKNAADLDRVFGAADDGLVVPEASHSSGSTNTY